MKARIVTTITTLIDLEDFSKEVSVDILDEDGIAEVSMEVLFATVYRSLGSAQASIKSKFPRPAEGENDGE